MFVPSEMFTMESTMTLKDHSGFKYVNGSIFPRQSKNKLFVFKFSIHLLGSGVDVVKCILIRGDIEISRINLLMSNA